MAERKAGMPIDKFTRLFEIVRELRERCPWDREQTLTRLAKGLVEESYETLDAIERDDVGELKSELGDLLVQIMFAAVIGAEEKRFTLGEIIAAASDKLIRRHPHVYGDTLARNPEEAVVTWERVKRKEREQAGERSALDGIARTLPALIRAEKLGTRARAAGLDWSDSAQVIAKVREELAEAEAAIADGDRAAAAQELGDAMLALANVPRFLDSSAEDALRGACDKFVIRFRELEEIARARRLDLRSLSEDALETLWQESKRRTRDAG